jgi:serine protease Do
VIDGATDVKVHLSDKRELTAKIVGSDKKTDIAVLKVDATDLPVLPLGNSKNVEVGDIVLAIGNPFGIGKTVTMGIVGATGRRGLSIEDYEDFIQTDAAINPGNSGGALINTRGELIGINTAILSRSGGNQGVGFAVPVNLAHHVMKQIMENGKVVRGYLGVLIQPVNPAIAKAFGVSKNNGALVGDVTAGSPASKAGVKQGDVITSVDGTPVDDPSQLRLQIASMAPGTEVNLKVLRDGKEQTIPVTLGELPSQPGENAKSEKTSSPMSGLSVDDLSPAVAQQLDLPAGTKGVVIVNVQPGSAAADAGLRRGDVISEVARKPVTTVEEFNQAVRAAGTGDVLLLVNRGGSSMYVVVESR